eukprot:gene32828-43883_t
MEKTEATCGCSSNLNACGGEAFTQSFLGTMTNNLILYLDSLPSSDSNEAN